MATVNINSSRELIVDSESKAYSQKEITAALNEMFTISGFEIIKITKRKSGVLLMNCLYSQKVYTFICIVRNISNSGWKEKPFIKRIQIQNLRLIDPSLYIDTTDTSTVLILGYYNFDANPLFVMWDFYQYTMHKTQRSCYVNIGTMLKAYSDGIFAATDSKQKVWAFIPTRFKEVIFKYIKERVIS